MKKSIKILFAIACFVAVCSLFTACDLFGAPKVKGCTYERSAVECDTSSFSQYEVTQIQTEVNNVKSTAATKLVFSADDDDDQVEYYSASAGFKMYTYVQSGVDVILFEAPNKNAKYGRDNERVTCYSVTRQSNEVLTYELTKTFTYNNEEKEITIVITYNLVTDAE